MTREEVLAVLGCYVTISRTRVRPPVAYRVEVYGGDPIPVGQTRTFLCPEAALRAAKEIAEERQLLLRNGVDLRPISAALEKEFYETSKGVMWEDFLRAKAAQL